ncbi:MAG: hypothetical protein JNN30_00005 [Rhodanobacteraceae bacterium]|nr:hypothetical protein [Rhodanobacteraceae bacterium]
MTTFGRPLSAVIGVDLWPTLGLAIWLGLGLVAVLIMAMLYQDWQHARSRFAMRLVDALSLGSLSQTQHAIDLAVDVSPDDDLRNAA